MTKVSNQAASIFFAAFFLFCISIFRCLSVFMCVPFICCATVLRYAILYNRPTNRILFSNDKSRHQRSSTFNWTVSYFACLFVFFFSFQAIIFINPKKKSENFTDSTINFLIGTTENFQTLGIWFGSHQIIHKTKMFVFFFFEFVQCLLFLLWLWLLL